MTQPAPVPFGYEQLTNAQQITTLVARLTGWEQQHFNIGLDIQATESQIDGSPTNPSLENQLENLRHQLASMEQVITKFRQDLADLKDRKALTTE